MDPMSIIGIFTVVFGVSVTFAALLLMRTRERYVADGGSSDAVATGPRETAAAATGAGLVMVAALLVHLGFICATAGHVRSINRRDTP
jgi:hypothetical protein